MTLRTDAQDDLVTAVAPPLEAEVIGYIFFVGLFHSRFQPGFIRHTLTPFFHLMVTGKPNRPIGAELRGTGHRRWRGLAPGTSKNAGYFWIGPTGSTRILLRESAIDAISGFQLSTHVRMHPFRDRASAWRASAPTPPGFIHC